MNLAAIQNEVLARGFDTNVYGARIINWINDAQTTIARRCDYYVNQTVFDFNTVQGQSNYPLPASFARMLNLTNTAIQQSLDPVSIRDVDNAVTVQGQPYFYAFEGPTIRLYPTPDSAMYPMQMRYWAMPNTLVNSTDIPNLPSDYHNLLWIYATWMAFEADDDSVMGQYWQTRWNTGLAGFDSDQKFPNTDYPTVCKGMWDQEGILSPRTWRGYW